MFIDRRYVATCKDRLADMSRIENRPAIVLTRSDRDRLSNLIARPGARSSTAEFLRQEIERAEIVPDAVGSSLVTLGSRVQFIDHKSHRISEGRLTFPDDVETDHAISILSPLGSALLGLGPGQSIDWIDDAGQDHRLTVVSILPHGPET
jgi:regulator of nucleoside diphosphate kinase